MHTEFSVANATLILPFLLSLACPVVEDLLAVGTFRAKEKLKVNVQTLRDWSFAERARR